MFLPLRDGLDRWINLDHVREIYSSRDGSYQINYAEGGGTTVKDPEAVAALKAWLEDQAPKS